VAAQRTAFRRLSVVALGAVFFTGCAQTNTLFDGTTGALPSASQTVQAGAGVGGPPLPVRRKPNTERSDDDGGLFAALPDVDLTAQPVAPLSVVADDSPVNLYVRLARQIRRCWLGSDDPRLPGHGFRAEAKPAGEAEIDVYKEVPGRKYGPFAFEVKITPQAGGSLVRSTNRRLEDELATVLRADIARWVRGGTGCSNAGRGNA
jgi:hypothetical protein